MKYKLRVLQYAPNRNEFFIIQYKKWYWPFWKTLQTVLNLHKYGWPPHYNSRFFLSKENAYEFASSLKLDDTLNRYLKGKREELKSATKIYREMVRNSDKKNKTVNL